MDSVGGAVRESRGGQKPKTTWRVRGRGAKSSYLLQIEAELNVFEVV